MFLFDQELNTICFFVSSHSVFTLPPPRNTQSSTNDDSNGRLEASEQLSNFFYFHQKCCFLMRWKPESDMIFVYPKRRVWRMVFRFWAQFLGKLRGCMLEQKRCCCLPFAFTEGSKPGTETNLSVITQDTEHSALTIFALIELGSHGCAGLHQSLHFNETQLKEWKEKATMLCVFVCVSELQVAKDDDTRKKHQGRGRGLPNTPASVKDTGIQEHCRQNQWMLLSLCRFTGCKKGLNGADLCLQMGSNLTHFSRWYNWNEDKQKLEMHFSIHFNKQAQLNMCQSFLSGRDVLVFLRPKLVYICLGEMCELMNNRGLVLNRPRHRCPRCLLYLKQKMMVNSRIQKTWEMSIAIGPRWW